MTREMLDDLLADVPRQVVPAVDAAWRAGTLRRRFRYASGAVTAVVMVVLAAVAILGFDPSPRVEPADGGAVTGYPSEIPRPITLTQLPDKPGPMAGVIQLDTDPQWALVDPRGRSWGLPDVSRWDADVPMLSDDGRMLGYLREVSEDRSEFRIVDLTSGARVDITELGDNPTADQPYYVEGASPGFWSPDNEWLVMPGSRDGTDGWGPLLVRADGGVLTPVGTSGWPAGWLDADRFVLVRDRGVVLIVDTDGVLRDRFELELPEGLRVYGQWGARVSPDGSQLALLAGPDADEYVRLTFDLESRRQTSRTPWRGSPSTMCPMQWQGDSVLGWESASGLVEGDTGQVVVEPSSRWVDLVSCGMFAADALAGQPRDGPGITEWRYWEFLWAWQKILAGLLVIGFVGGIFHLDRRARRRDGEAT